MLCTVGTIQSASRRCVLTGVAYSQAETSLTGIEGSVGRSGRRLGSALSSVLVARWPADKLTVGSHDAHHVARGPAIAERVERHLYLVAGLHDGLGPTPANHFPDARHLKPIGYLRAVGRDDIHEQPTMRIAPLQPADGAVDLGGLGHVVHAEGMMRERRCRADTEGQGDGEAGDSPHRSNRSHLCCPSGGEVKSMSSKVLSPFLARSASVQRS